jgi:hypothetical protein
LKNENDFRVICKTKDEIKMTTNLFFYECKGDLVSINDIQKIRNIGEISNNPYVKIFGIEGTPIYISIEEINTLLLSNDRVYYVYPKKVITYYIEWNDINRPTHLTNFKCKPSPPINIYTLKVCEGDCIISNKFR